MILTGGIPSSEKKLYHCQYPPQIPRGLTTQEPPVVAVRTRRLTAWALLVSYIVCNIYFLFLSKQYIFIIEKKKHLVLFTEIITFYYGNCAKHFFPHCGCTWANEVDAKIRVHVRPHCLPHHLCTLLSCRHNTHLLSSICSERVAHNGKYNVSANNNRGPQASEPPHDIIRAKPDVPSCCR